MFKAIVVLSCFVLTGSAFGGNKKLRSRAYDKYATFRVVHHTKAYLPRPELGEHVSIKVTPPELRGRAGHVAVEIYNKSNRYISRVDFDVTLRNNNGDRIDAKVSGEDLDPRGGGIKWIKIPGNATFPKIHSVEVQNVNILDPNGRQLPLDFYTDLIKQ